MNPVVFEIPLPFGKALPIHGYGLMIVLGFLIGTYVATRETRRRGLPDFMYDLGLVILLAGILGGRVFYYAQNYADKYSNESFLEFFKIWKGGLVFYGGAIGGILGGLFYIWRRKLPLGVCLDMAALGIPIGMGFGRLGCFLNGCCYGDRCDPGFALGVEFPAGSPAQTAHWECGLLATSASSSLPVHPVQLYQAGHDFLMFALVFWFLRRPGTPSGAGLPLICVLYGIGRFSLEFLRADNPATWSGLTVSQNVSILIVASCLPILLWVLIFTRKELKDHSGISKKTP